MALRVAWLSFCLCRQCSNSYLGFFLLLSRVLILPECRCCAGLTADEEMARRLQAEYDREVASHVLDQPDDAAMRRMAGSAFHSSPQSTPSTAHSSQSAASPASQPGRPPSGVAPVRYPSLGNSGAQQGLCINLMHICIMACGFHVVMIVIVIVAS